MPKLFRGKIISPLSESGCDFFPDGGLVCENEEILECDHFDKLADKYNKAEIIETGGLILPALVDVHVHWVQNQVKGKFGGTLLPWLKEHIWPEEARFSDEKYAEKMAERFFHELRKNGTGSAIVYSSVHQPATEIAIKKGMECGNFVIGNVLMDQNSPEYLQISSEEELKITESLAKKYRGKYAVTPRFAPTCTMNLMKRVAKIAAQYDCVIQTHLSENKDEITWVHDLFPEQKNYTEVYREAGLLGPRTVLGHCIHLSDDEWEVLKKSGSKVAHCPTSNMALESGRMPVEKLREYGIHYALGTDVGAGPKLSMFDVMRAYVEVHEGRVSAIDALYRASLAGAQIMGTAENSGNLSAGKQADFLVINNDLTGEDAEEILQNLLQIPCENLKFRA